MNTENEFITEFLDPATIQALGDFLKKEDRFNKAADAIASAFGSADGFTKMKDADIKKLVVSFKHNLSLLIQKTWVEKSDIALKDQLLYKMESFLSSDEAKWSENYTLFREIIDQAVYLMFGQPTDTPDFAIYTLRIDPEFGIFWWYISSLPAEANWSEDKCRVAMMLGMYFLANY